MAAAGVPSASRLAIARPPCVVKADGLAAGKGVFVCRTQDEVDEAMRALSGSGTDVVVEELLDGPEVSLFAICDGREARPLVSAQDFKRAFDGDEGPNTGGMGAYAPAVGIDASDGRRARRGGARAVLAELAERGSPFVGLLYAGLMLTPDGPRVLEFNCRFGDPETQAVVPLLDGDLLEALAAAARGDVSMVDVELVGWRGGDRGAGSRAVPGGGRPRRHDRGRGRRRAGRRARVPRRNGAAGRAAGDERRTDPGRDGARAVGRGGAHALRTTRPGGSRSRARGLGATSLRRRRPGSRSTPEAESESVDDPGATPRLHPLSSLVGELVREVHGIVPNE